MWILYLQLILEKNKTLISTSLKETVLDEFFFEFKKSLPTNSSFNWPGNVDVRGFRK